MGAETKYNWIDNPTESGVAVCDTDVLNDCLMHLKYENIGLNKITNCLLEVPQRIKYDLTDGVLTIKAGSVVIVPYGVEDLTAQYPVGSTFLNDNFKVVDTQFADGKFFVWAELVGDVVVDNTWNTANTGYIFLRENYSFGQISEDRLFSGGTAPTITKVTNLWYDTARNKLYRTPDTGTTWREQFCFPILKCSWNYDSTTLGYFTEVTQVFNGMGYIGSTVWVDKGVKGLIPNGRNEDGTLKNIEFTTDKLLLSTTTGVNHPGMYITISSKGSFMFYSKTTSTGDRYYDWDKNLVVNTGTDPRAILGEFQTDANKNIINYDSKLAFHAPDIQDVVRKTGDTMSGVLELYGTSSHLGLFGGSIFTHNMNISMDTAPSSNIYFPVVEHQDKNNTRKSRVESFFKTDGSHGIQLSEKHGSNYSAVTTGFDANGNPYTYAPHCSINNSIVTQAGLSKATNGYCKFGNGLIIQWGHVTGNNKSSVTLTFPTAFTSKSYKINFNQYGTAITNSAWINAITITGVSTTTCTFICYVEQKPTYHWIAVGY